MSKWALKHHRALTETDRTWIVVWQYFKLEIMKEDI